MVLALGEGNTTAQVHTGNCSFIFLAARGASNQRRNSVVAVELLDDLCRVAAFAAQMNHGSAKQIIAWSFAAILRTESNARLAHLFEPLCGNRRLS